MINNLGSIVKEKFNKLIDLIELNNKIYEN